MLSRFMCFKFEGGATYLVVVVLFCVVRGEVEIKRVQCNGAFDLCGFQAGNRQHLTRLLSQLLL